MKKILLALVLSSAALLPAATALAADLDVPPPPTEDLRPATYDWTGIYVGGWVGATCIDGGLTDISATPDTYWEMAGCGFKGGALAGYNHQFNNWVMGVEGDWGTTSIIAANDESGGDFSFAMDHLATLRFRSGIAFDDTLIFATVGGAYAVGDLDGINGATDPDHIKGHHWGMTFGGGFEHAVTDNFRLRLDYLYTKFKGDNYYSTSCSTTCDVDVHDFDDHEVRLGAIWAF